MSERILTTLVPEGARVVAVTTSAGSVHTIGPAHRAYERIARLAISRDDDETLLGLITGQTTTGPTRTPVRRLFEGHEHAAFTTDDDVVWYEGRVVPDAVGSEILFLVECLVDGVLTRDLGALLFFAEALVMLDDTSIRDEFVMLHTKRLLDLDTEGRILVTLEGSLYVTAPREEATHAVRLDQITTTRRRRGHVAFTVTDHDDVHRR